MRDTITDIEALTRLRAERGMTMAALARAAGVSYSMVKYVHYGERQFSHVTAAAIARALGCDPRDFSRPGTPPRHTTRDAA